MSEQAVKGLDYLSRLAEKSLDWEAGTGTATVTIPAGAWLTAVSFAAGVSAATLIVTPAGASAKPTITVSAGGAFSSVVADMGQFAGATFAFDSTSEYYVEWKV